MFAVALLTAPAANAGSYTVDIGCRDGTRADDGVAISGWHRNTSSKMIKQNGCGTPWNGGDPARWGMATAPNGSAWPGADIKDRVSGWSFLAPGNPLHLTAGGQPDAPFTVRTARISSATTGMSIRRNANIDYAIVMLANGQGEGSGVQLLYGCASGTTTPTNAIGVTSPDCNTTGLTGFFTSTFNVPGTALSIGMGVTCPLANCPTTPSSGLLLVSSDAARFTVTETSGPEVTAFNPPSSTGWINAAGPSSISVGFSARDLVGLQRGSVSIDGNNLGTDNNPACSNYDGATISNYAPCITGADDAINNAGRIYDGRTINVSLASVTTDGTHNGALQAVDALGNTMDRPFTIQIDRTAPSATAPTSIPGSGQVTFTGVTDATSGIDPAQFTPEYSTDGGTSWQPLVSGSYNSAAATYSASFPPTVLGGTSVRVRLAERDIAGNPRSVTSGALVLPAQCADGVDNDGDGLVDTADPACHSDGNPANPGSYTPTVNSEAGPCGDGLDNNADGLIDRNQPSCHTDGVASNPATYDPQRTEVAGTPPAQCTDGADNDGDGFIDSADPACHSDGNPGNPGSYTPGGTEAGPCGDGRDNNNDDLIDRAQPSCHTDGNPANGASYDPTRDEVAGSTGGAGGGGGGGPQCGDGLDNDGDGLPDTRDPACHSDGNPANPASYVATLTSESGDCGDGKDNNNDGQIDRFQASCYTSGRIGSDTYDPKRPELADAPASVCGTRKLNLLDVYVAGGRVQLLGYARSQFVGQQITIRQAWNRAVAARLVVGDDGYFRGTAKLPAAGIRNTNRARYQAVIGSESSLNLKLARRMVSTGVRIMPDGTIKMSGRVVRPLRARGGRQPVVTIKRRVNCDSPYVVVKRNVKVSASGAFRALLPAPPPGSGGAVYRAQTLVPRRSVDHKTSPTFTLPRAIDTL